MADLIYEAGEYEIDDVSVSGPFVRGDGVGATTLRLAPSATTGLRVTADNVVIRDLSIVGSVEVGSGDVQVLVRAESVNGLTVTRCALSGGHVQVRLDTGSGHRVHECSFADIVGTESGYGYGVLMGAAQRCSVDGCSFDSAAGQGRHHVYMSAGSSNNRVQGNAMHGGAQAQVAVFATDAQSACNGNVIAENVLSGMDSQVNAAGA